MSVRIDRRVQFPTVFGLEIALLFVSFCVIFLGYLPVAVRALGGALSFLLAGATTLWAGRMQSSTHHAATGVRMPILGTDPVKVFLWATVVGITTAVGIWVGYF
jgi:hypothetical protein